jgi:hypothetical protein
MPICVAPAFRTKTGFVAALKRQQAPGISVEDASTRSRQSWMRRLGPPHGALGTEFLLSFVKILIDGAKGQAEERRDFF